MSENSKIYIVLGVVVAIIIGIVGYYFYTEKQSEKIYNNFVETLNSSEEKIVFIGRKGCGWCQLFQPIFDYYAEEYEFAYQSVDTDKLTGSDFNKIIDTLLVEEDNFGTPAVAFVKDGKVVDEIIGYVDERELLEILQNHEFIPEEETNVLDYLDFTGLKKVFSSKEKSIVVVGQTTCSYCIRFKPILMNISNTKNISINYINYDEIEEQEELGEFLGKFEIFQGKWGTPLTFVVEDGKIVSHLSGYTTEDVFLDFLRNNNLIEE